MRALEFANSRENVVIRIAGNGCPAGQDIAWMPPETELPFRLDDIEGMVKDDGTFEAINLCTGGSDRYYTQRQGEWWVHDWNGNIIYAIWLRVDEEVWKEQNDELNA